MHIIITYNDGKTELVPVRLEGGVVSCGHEWMPGHIVDNPCLCRFASDYFGSEIDEGNQRFGNVQPAECDIDPDTGKLEWEGFRWELVGTESDACREKISKWIGALGPDFDPLMRGEEYLHGGLLRRLTSEQARDYDWDMDCWMHYLDDPDDEARKLGEEANFSGQPSHVRGP